MSPRVTRSSARIAAQIASNSTPAASDPNIAEAHLPPSTNRKRKASAPAVFSPEEESKSTSLGRTKRQKVTIEEAASTGPPALRRQGPPRRSTSMAKQGYLPEKFCGIA